MLDYIGVCDAVGPLNFASFADGHRDYETFLRGSRDTAELRVWVAGVAAEARQRERHSIAR